MKLDTHGLLVQDDGDGGDSARSEWSYYLAGCAAKRNEPYELFNNEMTEMVRNPTPNMWWSNPSLTSRDQALHAFTYLADSPTREVFYAFLKAHIKRGLRCQNGDLLWANINTITRAMQWSILWPITVLWDISLLIGAMERCHWLPRWDQDNKRIVWRNDPDDVGDDLNLQMSFAQPGHPSPVRWLARKLYVKFRPEVYIYGSPVNRAHACWCWYYRKEAENQYNLATLWAKNCKKLF